MNATVASHTLVAVEEVLTQLALDAHGALSVLGSTCIKQFGGAEVARARVSEWVDVWRSDVIVARQLLRSTDDGDVIREALDRLLKTVTSLGAAFTELVGIAEVPPAAAADLSNVFPTLYRKLEQELEEVGQSLRLELSFPSQFNSLRRVTFERSLKWIGEELDNIAKSVQLI